ncbi:YciI family protein [Phytomonospora sp. NPDC050363]|uniref:YciI family protein n=1 Tax=Phytomonospora sp. NPDC050363 TaxID=3155642 RepID=UPI0034114260
MKYLISMYQPDGPIPDKEVLDVVMRDLNALGEQIREAGGWVFAGGLHPPSTATVLRARDGEVVMTDGPYVEGKEHLGGFTIVEAPELDTVLAWAGREAEITGLPIEVRPFSFDE